MAAAREVDSYGKSCRRRPCEKAPPAKLWITSVVQVVAAQDLESVPNVCGGIAANTPTNVGVSFLGQKKGAGSGREAGAGLQAGRLRRTDGEQQEGSGERMGSTSHASAPHLHSRNTTNHPGLRRGNRPPCRPPRSQAPQARPAPPPNAPLPRSAQSHRAAHLRFEGVRRPPAPLAQIP